MCCAQSKKLLLIRPAIPNDEYTCKFSYPASSQIGPKALVEGWEVTDLGGEAANRANVERSISNIQPDLIIHYNHGGPLGLFGQLNNTKETVIDSANVGLLSRALVSTVSCSSAFLLGPLANAASTRLRRAYLGYSLPIWTDFRYVDYYTQAANAANFALLEGKTFLEAKNIGFQQYTSEIMKLLALNDPRAVVAAIGLWHDRNGLFLHGDGEAKAYDP